MIRSLLSPARGWMITLLSCLLLAAPAGADQRTVYQQGQGNLIENNTNWWPVCSYVFAPNEFVLFADANIRMQMPYDFLNNSGGTRWVEFRLEIDADAVPGGVANPRDVWVGRSLSQASSAVMKQGYLELWFSDPITVRVEHWLAATNGANNAMVSGPQVDGTGLQDGWFPNDDMTATIYARLGLTASVNLTFQAQDCIVSIE
jgi:hypothetical protein